VIVKAMAPRLYDGHFEGIHPTRPVDSGVRAG
jgi:hypothetical protein